MSFETSLLCFCSLGAGSLLLFLSALVTNLGLDGREGMLAGAILIIFALATAVGARVHATVKATRRSSR